MVLSEIMNFKAMQEIKLLSNSITSDTPADLQHFSINELYHKNILKGVKNACTILDNLEHSIAKTNSYEDKLLQCRATHKHSHSFNEWSWDDDLCDKDLKSTKANTGMKTSQVLAPVNLVESWSTMSIVCLQYQYEELSKRYETLLKAFNDKCNEIALNTSTLTRLRQQAREMHAQLAAAHRALLCVGEKYLALKKRKQMQLKYVKKMEYLKDRVRDVVATAEKARLHHDRKLAQTMAVEHNSEYAMLLAEMRKCNQLFLENLRLKAQLDALIPGSANWT